MTSSHHPFLAMLEQHRPAIDRICRSFAHGNAEDLEDLRQEVVLNLWRGWQHYRPDHASLTWVWRVATNTGISWLRHRRRQPATLPLKGLELADSSQTEALETLQALMMRLPPRDRQLLQLYLEGWSHAEIAAMLQTTETNVQTRLCRARQKMKGYLDE